MCSNLHRLRNNIFHVLGIFLGIVLASAQPLNYFLRFFTVSTQLSVGSTDGVGVIEASNHVEDGFVAHLVFDLVAFIAVEVLIIGVD